MAVTERRQWLLIHADARTALRKAIVLVQETLLFRIDVWVPLPDHLYGIWTLPWAVPISPPAGSRSSAMSPVPVGLPIGVPTI